MKQVQIKGETYNWYDVRTLINVNKDLAYHNGEAGNESWFIVSNLESNGNKIGLQVQALIKKSVVSLNISLINETTGWYKSFEYVYNVKDILVNTEKFEIRAKDFHFSGNADQIIAHVNIPGATIDIQTQKVCEPLFLNCVGYTDFMGAKQYDFAFPRMSTSGNITLDDEIYPINGITWFDRQWGDLPGLAKKPATETEQTPGNPYAALQWIWINPQLSNGVNMSFGEAVIMSQKLATAFTTITYPDGAHTYTPTEFLERSDFWESKVTGNKYPTNFILRIPRSHTELEINIPYKEQEILSEIGGVTKYEGMASIKGIFEGKEVTGQAYVEMVGNWQ